MAFAVEISVEMATLEWRGSPFDRCLESGILTIEEVLTLESLRSLRSSRDNDEGLTLGARGAPISFRAGDPQLGLGEIQWHFSSPFKQTSKSNLKMGTEPDSIICRASRMTRWRVVAAVTRDLRNQEQKKDLTPQRSNVKTDKGTISASR